MHITMCVCVWGGCARACQSNLQVPVHDPHLVEVVHGIQDLSDQCARILLCVKSFFHDSVKQLSPRHPEAREIMMMMMCV